MIVVKLQGGLGNQMFQYAIGKRLALYYDTPLKLDRSTFILQDDDKNAQVTPRRYELSQLSVEAAFAEPADISVYLNRSNLMHRIRKFITRSKFIIEKNFAFDPSYLSFGKNCYLSGYWQCEQYFSAISGLIRQDFKCSRLPDAMNIEMEARIKSANAVSLHIRRGDYVHNPSTQKFHGICSTEYYQEAVKLVAEKVANPHFFIFSDDVEWVTENFTTGYPTTIVAINDSYSGVKDMQLMSACNHHIIANSSFSWWGAWLGTNVNKIVVAPKKWFADPSVDTSTVLPQSWYKL